MPLVVSGKTFYSISEVAGFCGIVINTVRYWIEKLNIKMYSTKYGKRKIYFVSETDAKKIFKIQGIKI